MVYSTLDVFTAVVYTWAGRPGSIPATPADILAAALTWLGKLHHQRKVAVKTWESGKLGLGC